MLKPSSFDLHPPWFHCPEERMMLSSKNALDLSWPMMHWHAKSSPKSMSDMYQRDSYMTHVEHRFGMSSSQSIQNVPCQNERVATWSIYPILFHIFYYFAKIIWVYLAWHLDLVKPFYDLIFMYLFRILIMDVNESKFCTFF